MSQLRLYLDEDSMRKSFVSGLRARNPDTLTASEAEMINRGDEDHLHAASATGRALYSYNLEDFCILHKAWVSQGISHAGIIVAPQQRYTLGQELRRLMLPVGDVTAEEMRNRIEFLSGWG